MRKSEAKAPISYEEYKRLELIPDSAPTQPRRWFWQWLQAVLVYFDGRSGLRVWQASQNGQIVWRVYDPITHRRAEFADELDLRVWLEERYYQPASV